jgi:ATP-dependent Lon protease
VAVGVVKEEYADKTLTLEDVEEILGPDKFLPETAERTGAAGVATGMAWTRTGGDILFIEATQMPGKGKMRVTGQLGDVMKESAQIALSLVESKAAALGIDSSVFDNRDIHLHVPAGAVPKDGPSAGVTMFTALTSLLTNVRVRHDVSMTGEATLRGLVLPVGGIKDKVLAAQRAGIKKVILPERNRRDLRDIPDSAKEHLEFVFAKTIDDVLQHALEEPPTPPTEQATAPAAVA